MNSWQYTGNLSFPLSTYTPTQPSSDTQPDTGNRVGEGEEVEEEGNSTYYIPVVLGVVMMVALALVTLAVLLRYT